MTNLHMCRSATLDGFAPVAKECGLDTLQLLDDVGIPHDALTCPDLKIPSRKVLQLYNLAAERSGFDDFGLRVAHSRQFGHLGAVGMLVREQPTAGKALYALSENLWAHAQGLSIEIMTVDALVVVSLNILVRAVPSVRQNTEVGLAVIANILHHFLGQEWKPEMVLFRHSRPKNPAMHVAVFRCLPLFDQEFNAIVVRAADLETPIPRSDERIAAQLQRYLELTAGNRVPDFAEDVRGLINSLLPSGRAEIERVAQTLGIDRRTVHRRLAAQGTSFSALLQNERVRLATLYLEASSNSQTEIADLLGFSSLSSFSRWKRSSLRPDRA